MTLDQIRKLITPFIDGELSPQEYGEVQKQLRENEAVRTMMEQEGAVKEIVRTRLPRVSAPAGLRQRILAEVDKAPSKRSIFERRNVMLQFRPITLYAAAAVLCIAMLGSLYTWDRPQQTQGLPEHPMAMQTIAAQSWKDIPLHFDDGGNVVLKGRIVCLNCKLTEAGLAHIDCDKYGHRFVLKTEHGLFVSFLTNEQSDHLVHEEKVAGLNVQIVGKLCTKSNYIDIQQYKKLV